MIFYSVDNYNVYRKHEDIDPIPTMANTIETVVPGTQTYQDMQEWANQNGNWVYFPDAPPPPEVVAEYAKAKKAEIANSTDQYIGGLLAANGYGRVELDGLRSRVLHARNQQNNVSLPANCSLIKDSVISGESVPNLAAAAIAFEAELDELTGTIAGHRRNAIALIDAATDQAAIDQALYDYNVTISQLVNGYTFTSLF